MNLVNEGVTVQKALESLGVREGILTETERTKLDHDGFVVLRNVIHGQLVEEMRSRVDSLVDLCDEGDKADSGRSHFLTDLVNKDAVFDACFTHPRVLGAVSYVLDGDVKLSSLNMRAARPGQGLQGLHADWHEPAALGAYLVCNTVWMLDDFTETNGTTRLVPGSHRSGQLPSEVMEDVVDTHPDEVRLLGRAGDVAIFNSHVWHGGTRNTDGRPRRGIFAYFTRQDRPQQLDQQASVQPGTLARLSPAAIRILGISIRTPS